MNIEIKNLKKSYKNSIIFEDVNLNFSSGIYAIVGESGEGKTTLLNLIFGIDTEYSGDVNINGKNYREFSEAEINNLRISKLKYVFQDFKLYNNMTVQDSLKLICESESEILEVASSLGIDHVLSHRIKDISGGQKQRVAIARALLNGVEVLLLDEPTSNLDKNTADNVIMLLQQLRDKGICIIVSTHDSRVMDIASEVLHVEKEMSNEKKKKNLKHIESEVEENFESKKYDFKIYLLLKEKYKVKNLTLNGIIISFFSLVLLLLVALSLTVINKSYARFFGSLPEDVIMLEAYPKDNYEQPLSAFNFTEEEVNQVKSIEGVENVYIFTQGLTSEKDEDGNKTKLIVNTNEYMELFNKYPSVSRLPNTISFGFCSLDIPTQLLGSYNPNGINLIEGNYPDAANELLVPDIFQDLYANEVGEEIEIPVISESGAQSSEKYTISGVYKTNYKQTVEYSYPIYLRQQKNEILASELSELYKESVNMLADDPLYSSLVTSEDEFKTALGTGEKTMYIEYSGDEAAIVDQLESIFPAYEVYSQEILKSEYSTAYNAIKLMAIIGLAIVLGMFSLILHAYNKMYIQNEIFNSAIDYSLGYSKKQIKLVYIFEVIGVSTVAFGIVAIILNMVLNSVEVYILNIETLLTAYILIICIGIISNIKAIKLNGKTLIEHLK